MKVKDLDKNKKVSKSNNSKRITDEELEKMICEKHQKGVFATTPSVLSLGDDPPCCRVF